MPDVTNTIAVVIVAILFLVITFSLLNAGTEPLSDQQRIQREIESLQTIEKQVRLVGDPDLAVSCAKQGERIFRYTLDVKNLMVVFGDDKDETKKLEIVPVAFLYDSKEGNEQQRFTLTPGEQKSLSIDGLKYTFQSFTPPTIFTHEKTYSGTLLPRQTLAIDNYRIRLTSLREPILSLLSSTCRASFALQCNDKPAGQLDSFSLESCDSNEKKCTRDLSLCDSLVSTRLASLTPVRTGTNVITGRPKFECSEQTPTVVVSVGSTNKELTYKDTAIIMFYENPPEGREDCWKGTTCPDLLRGSYELELDTYDAGACL